MLKAAILAGFALSSFAFADVVIFNSPSGNLGATQNYTLDGVTITASGFNGGDLFGKNAGVNEEGLGLTGDPTGDNEIFFIPTGAPQDFVQLDMINLINAGFSNIQFEMNSTSSPDAWSVSACSAAGVDCFTSPVTGTDQSAHNVPVSLSKVNHYLDFSATNGNVLLSSISATAVPEPQFYWILGFALLSLVVVRARRRSA